MDIQTEELSYWSTNKSDTIKATLWYDSAAAPKAVVQITHGMCEYMNRYQDFAEFLVKNGFAVCGNDHLGHGRTAPSDEKLGYFAPFDGDKYLVEDVHELYKIIRERFPAVPYFLLGHSMGSFITRSYITKYGDELDGYICCGTGGPNPLGKIAVAIANIEIKRLGEFGRSTLLDKLAFGNYNARFTENRTKYDWLTRDTAIVDKYNADRWCTYLFTAPAFRDMFLLLNQVSSKVWANKVPKDLPIFIISGKMDPVGNFGKGARQVFDLLYNAGIKTISLKLYTDCRHEILNELNRQEVYTDIAEWFDTRIKQSQKSSV